MASQSPSVLAKNLESDVRLILRGSDLHKFGIDLRNMVADLQQELESARNYAGYYEASEMRDEQLENAKTAKKFLGKVQRKILKISESGIFSAIDVAHLSAQIDRIKGELK